MENKNIIAEEQVFDRIEQSFKIFKNNFLPLFLPLFLYTSFTVVIFSNISKYYSMDFIQKLLDNYQKNHNFLELLNYDSKAIIWIYVSVILFVVYLTIYIPFLLATIKWVKQAYFWEKVDMKENIIYWFKNLFKSFQTYWFYFKYVALIPSLIWIVWGLLFIYWNFYNTNFKEIWLIISSFSVLLFFVFAIYRWVKASFYMSSAIDKNEFTQENFNYSVKVTDNNWWRILWNFLLLSIIISLVSWIFNSIIWLSGSSFDYSALLNTKENLKPEEIMNVVKQTVNSYSPIINFIKSILENVINIIWTVFLLIFTYIFFKRLEIENNPEKSEEDSSSSSEEKIEL